VGVFERILWAATLGLAAALAGCSSAMIDKLPAEMGLPANTPARPETPYEYPAVHDMPPARASAPMTEDEQVKLEKDLANVRDRQEERSAADEKPAPAAKKPPAPAKKPPNDAANGQTAGTKADP
jgi:hypothetical protein